MGLLRSIQRHFERTASHELKRRHRTLHTTFKIIDSQENQQTQAECLKSFRDLKADVDAIFEKHPVLAKAAGKPDKSRDGWRASLSALSVVGICYALLSAFDGTSMPLLASTPIIAGMIGGVAAFGVCACTAGYFVISRHRAHTLGLTPSDVKYAKKLDHMRVKLECRINKLDNMDDITAHLEQIDQKYEEINNRYKDSLHKQHSLKFNASSAKRAKGQDEVPAAAQVKTPAEVKPNIKNDPAVSGIKQLLDDVPSQKKVPAPR